MATIAQRIDARGDNPVYQAYQILHFGFFLAPVIAGADKFAHLLVDWTMYLAPVVTQIVPLSAHGFMYLVGLVEIAAGLVVLFSPRIGGYLVAVWLWAIIINLLLIPGYLDIALRDFGLSLGALALARMAEGLRS